MPPKGYVTVSFPKGIIEEIRKCIEEDSTLYYRSPTEFCVDTVRRRLEELVEKRMEEENMDGVVAMIRDEIMKSEEKYRSLFNSLGDGIAVFIAPDGKLISFNENFQKIIGYSEDELKDMTFHDLVIPEDIPKVEKNFRARMEGRKLDELYVVRGRTKKGEIITTEISGVPYMKDGKIIGSEILIRDVTKREEFEETLKLMSDALDVSIHGFIMVDLEGKIIFANRIFEKMWGHNILEATKMSFDDLWMEKEHETVIKEVIPKIMDGGWKGELMGKRKNGSPFPISTTCYCIKCKEGESIIALGIFRPIEK